MELPDDWKDILIHCGAAAVLTAASGLAGNSLIGAALAIGVFYGREQAQQMAKTNPLTGFHAYLPWKWGPHGKREFLCVLPVVALVAAGFVIFA